MMKVVKDITEEHGSSNILSERIALRDDKIKSLKERIAALEGQVLTLRKENDVLTREKGELKKKREAAN